MFAAILGIGRQLPDIPRSVGSQGPAKPTPVGRSGHVALVCAQDGVHASLGDRLWLTGRIRLDARDELRTRLGSLSASTSDAGLCLEAYARWGEAFTDFIAGDFAFALWDDERQRLLAVRDRLGVRARFQTTTDHAWLVSDSLDWLAAWEAGRPLDEYWIADFLTLGVSREFERTIYRDIKRVPPGHRLRLDDGGLSLRRYWKLDLAEPLYLPRTAAYHERFRELLSRAVSDRLPAGKVGIAMSGGVDSTTLAATAVEVTGNPSRIVAECEHYERLMHIREDHYATLAARHLGIELRIRPADDIAHDPQWRSRSLRTAEPTVARLNAHNMQQVGREMAALSPVWLDGEGPDNALTLERNAYLGWLWRRRSWLKLSQTVLQYGFAKGFSGWSQTLARRTRMRHVPELEPFDVLPPWLREDFAKKLNLAERQKALGLGGDSSHPWHPLAFDSFTSPAWQSYFDDHAFEESLGGFEWRYPFLDLRVLEFMLAVPPVPWGWKKHLIRTSMRGRLPRAVLAREKTPLGCYPEIATMRATGLPSLPEGHGVGRFVHPASLPSLAAQDPDLALSLGVYALDDWLAEKCQC